MSRVSVIIPVRNRKELLAVTIRNLLSQTRPPDEIIIVNDHSTDDTAEFVRRSFGNPVSVILSSGNGPGAARNTGFQHATGDFIKFFDSDDLLTLNSIEEQYNVLSNGTCNSVYSPCFKAENVSENTWKLRDSAVIQYRPVPTNHPLRWWMLRGMFIMVPAFMFRRELLAKAGAWRTDITTYEDWDFLWNLAGLEPNPQHTNKCAFLYRMHGVQTMGSSLSSSRRDYEKVLCFTNILKRAAVEVNRDTVGELTMKTIVAETLRKNRMEPWVAEFDLDWDSFQYRAISKALIVKNKLGRMRTGTDWQPMHGPSGDPEIIQKYLAMINGDYTLVQS